jgi:hypothetical protein
MNRIKRWVKVGLVVVAVFTIVGVIGSLLPSEDDAPATSRAGRGIPSPSATATPIGGDYFEAMAAESLRLADSFITMEELFTDPAPGDVAWDAAVSRELQVWANVAERVRALRPPAGYEDSHALMVEAMGELDMARTLLERGLEDRDPVAILEASEHIQSANDLTNRATDALLGQ